MPDRAEVVVLCEDVAHEQFLRALIQSYLGKRARAIRVYRVGTSSMITKNLPELLSRVRRAGSATALFVMVDADNLSLAERCKQSLSMSGDTLANDDNRICGLVPAWCIENWLYVLDSRPLPHDPERQPTEAEKRSARDISMKAVVDTFASGVRAESPPPHWTPSMLIARDKLRDVRKTLA